jgi:hypothetical protein
MQIKIEQDQKAPLSAVDENYQQWIAQTSLQDMARALKETCVSHEITKQSRLEFLGQAYKNKLDTMQGLNGKAARASHAVDYCVLSATAEAFLMLKGYVSDLEIVTNEIEPPAKKKPWYIFANKR